MEAPVQARQHPLRAIAQPGLLAIRRLWLPFLIIQSCGLILVIAYFQFTGVQAFCQRLADYKRAGGFVFSAVAMAIAGGIVPDVLKFLTGVDRRLTPHRLANLLFNTGLYAVSGTCSDAYYRALNHVFRDSSSASTVIAKVVVDQFVYTPIIGMTLIAVAYSWREHHFHPMATIRSLGVAWYISRVATLLVPCWAFWIPMTSLMYTLPASLNFVFCVVAAAAAATVLLAVAERKIDRPTASPSPPLASPRPTLQADSSPVH